MQWHPSPEAKPAPRHTNKVRVMALAALGISTAAAVHAGLSAFAAGSDFEPAVEASVTAPVTAPVSFAAERMPAELRSVEKPETIIVAQAEMLPASALIAKAGDRIKVPAELVARALGAGGHVIVHRAPDWVKVGPARSVGYGVWLVQPGALGTTELEIAATATGEGSVALVLFEKDGKKVAAEATVRIGIQPNAGAAPPPAATERARSAEASPAGGTPKLWTEFLANQVNPATAASSPGAGPAAASAAAPPPVQVAQARPAPARPAAAAPAAAKRSEADLIGYAKHLVRECTVCHSLYGQDDGIPPMIGLSRDRFLDTMDLYRRAKRDNQAMVSVAQALSEEETLALALYLGRIKPPTAAELARLTSAASAASAAPAVLPKRDISEKDAIRVDRWIKRGREMIDNGEIAQARLLLERATELGSPQAALLLATSYDPNALPWRPGMGLEAEPLRARTWYLHAQKLGAGAEASSRLADLPAPR